MINVERTIGPIFRIIGRFIRIIGTVHENTRIENNRQKFLPNLSSPSMRGKAVI